MRSFKDLLFPPRCIHCRETIYEEFAHLCAECTRQLQLIDPKERCPCCFTQDYCTESKRCFCCKPEELSVDRLGAAFDYMGPAASIVRKLKYGNQPYLAKGAGAFLVAQFFQLQWPLPDLIVPVPISFTHWLERGYNQSELLAESTSQFLRIPMESTLIRKSGDYSQAGMDRKQRKILTKDTLLLKKGHQLHDKRILLIDDVMTTGSTLQRCAEVLYEGCPAEVYALTFCRAIK
ncbi:MAG: ComF family protein [Parachlamydiaceae bacterium]|nr:ComF family protein [Parachlamydiaceae bacterium]